MTFWKTYVFGQGFKLLELVAVEDFNIVEPSAHRKLRLGVFPRVRSIRVEGDAIQTSAIGVQSKNTIPERRKRMNAREDKGLFLRRPTHAVAC